MNSILFSARQLTGGRRLRLKPASRDENHQDFGVAMAVNLWAYSHYDLGEKLFMIEFR
jgi:hypothetical protein